MSLPPHNQPLDWEALYAESELATLPWYHEKLDLDLEQAIRDLHITPGKALDLGTGPGTQAFELSIRGFTVTATDLSPSAIKKAAELFTHPKLTFLQDNILKTRLTEKFDLIFDRGCFHVLPPDKRAHYIATVADLLTPSGIFFLKCFSHKESREDGPHRFSPAEIRALFGRTFQQITIKESVYQGTLEVLPLTLFCTMRRE